MPLSDGMDIHFTSLHKILRNLYDQMTPLTDDIATFATGEDTFLDTICIALIL